MRLFLTLAFAGVISACALLDAPSAEAKKNVTSAYADLQTLVETARLGAYSKPASFQDAAPLYGSMIARLKAAKPPVSDGAPERDLGRVIDGCISNIADLSELHQSAGLRPTLEYDPFTIACTPCAIRNRGDVLMALDLKTFKPSSAEDMFKAVLGEIAEDGKTWWKKTQDTIKDHLQALTVSVMRTRLDLKEGRLTRKEAAIVFRAAQTSFETVVPFTRYLTAVLAQKIINTVVSAIGWAVFNLTGFNFFPAFVDGE